MEIRELLQELVTDEMIENAVSYKVSERFEYIVDKKIKEKVDEFVGNKADEFIKAEIEKVMANQVRIDDGWGNTKNYGSFDDYVRDKISKELRDGWNIGSKVRAAVDAKLKKYVEKAIKEKNEDRVDFVLQELAKDILKEGSEEE